MINAFYSFDPEPLAALLSDAGASAEALLYYQGWAEGGNYKIIERGTCVSVTPEQVQCSITVEDDPVMALGSDFKVTDTFHHHIRWRDDQRRRDQLQRPANLPSGPRLGVHEHA